MKKATIVLTATLMIIGIFMLVLSYSLHSEFIRETEYYGADRRNDIFSTWVAMWFSAFLIVFAPMPLVFDHKRLKKSYQTAISLIIFGTMLSLIPQASTYSLLGYQYSFTMYPFSFVGYPIIGIGFAVIIYKYCMNHLKIEIVQRKEDKEKTISTARLVWVERDEEEDTPDKKSE